MQMSYIKRQPQRGRIKPPAQFVVLRHRFEKHPRLGFEADHDAASFSVANHLLKTGDESLPSNRGFQIVVHNAGP